MMCIILSCHLFGIFDRPDDGLYDEGVAGVGDARECAVDEVRDQGKVVDVQPDELPVNAPTPERCYSRPNISPHYSKMTQFRHFCASKCAKFTCFQRNTG